MSAFIHENEHINLIVWAGTSLHFIRHNYDGMSIYNICGTGENFKITGGNPHEIGRILISENLASVSYRYEGNLTPEELSCVEKYTYVNPQYDTWSAEEVIMAIDSYCYQSCEHPQWKNSKAHAIVQAIREGMIRYLIDGAGTWSVVAGDKPAAEQQ